MSQDRIHLSNVAVLQLLKFIVRSGMPVIFALLHASLVVAANLDARLLGMF